MAVVAFTSAQLAADYRKNTREDHGKIRIEYFKVTTTEAGDANSTYDFVKLPQGSLRILPGQSRISVSAQGAGRTLDVGTLAYIKNGSGDEEAYDVDALIDGLDVSGAVVGVAFGTGIKFDIFSFSGVTIQGKILGDTTPSGTVIEGYIAYVQE